MNSFALINIAKKQLGFQEDDYRAMLKRVTGKDSLRAMDAAELRAVMAEMKIKGFRIHRGNGKWREGKKYSSKPYVRLVHALWKSVHEKGIVADGSKTALRAFVSNRTSVSDPEFLTYDEAAPVIEALKAMEARGRT